MSTDNFIHVPDVGKLIEAAGSLRALYQKRAEVSKRKFSEVPELRDSLGAYRKQQDTAQLKIFADRNNIPEVSLNALNSMLYTAAIEHEDINQMLRDIYTRMALYFGTELSVLKDDINKELGRINEPRERAIKKNAELMDITKSSNKEFSRKIAETEKLLEVRKQKFIRSLTKAFEVAGVPENLSESDLAVAKFLNHQGWVVFHGENYECVVDAIIQEDHDQSKRIFMKVKEIVIETFQKGAK
ncbi:hypothetical protein D3C87_952550 [compost metagenome]